MKRVLLADDEHASSEIIRYYIQKHQLPLKVVGETPSRAMRHWQPFFESVRISSFWILRCLS